MTSGQRPESAIKNVAVSLVGVGAPLLAVGRIPMFIALGTGIVLGLVLMILRDRQGFMTRAKENLLLPALVVSFLIVTTIGAALGERPEVSLPKAADLAMLAVLLWVAVQLARDCTVREARLMILAFLIGVLFAMAFSLGDSLSCIRNLQGSEGYEWCVKRARHRGTAFAVMFPAVAGSAWCLFQGARRGLPAAAALFLFLLALSVLLSNGRTAWVTLAAGTVLLTGLLIWRGHFDGFWKLWVAVPAAAGIYYFILTTVHRSMLASRTSTLDSPEFGAFNGRETAWREAITLWQENPLLGAGVWSYRHLVDHFNHPHNFALELLAETGILGVLTIGAALVVGAGQVLRRTAVGPASAGFAASIACFFLAASAATSVFYGWWLCILFGVVVVGVAAHRIEAEDPA